MGFGGSSGSKASSHGGFGMSKTMKRCLQESGAENESRRRPRRAQSGVEVDTHQDIDLQRSQDRRQDHENKVFGRDLGVRSVVDNN